MRSRRSTVYDSIDGNDGEIKKIKRKCIVLNVMEAKAWRNVTVMDLTTKQKYFFGKVK